MLTAAQKPSFNLKRQLKRNNSKLTMKQNYKSFKR